jgi:hypothetical protein
VRRRRRFREARLDNASLSRRVAVELDVPNAGEQKAFLASICCRAPVRPCWSTSRLTATIVRSAVPI